MIETIEIMPGVVLRCWPDTRFKQGALSIQFLRPMCAEEAALNALLPAVLLRGTEKNRDLRAITARLDDLYGASVSALVRRVGDYQTTGVYCAFMEDRFAFAGDEILVPMVRFLKELLLEPVLFGDSLCPEFVESEKRNLIAAIESERNDKRAYAAARLLRIMCSADSFGIPRLGTVDAVAQISGKSLYAHYRRVLAESPVEVFYVGSAPAETVAGGIRALFSGMCREPAALPEQSPFHDVGGSHQQETMEVTQAKLCMGFVTPITNQSADFAAMQVMNTLYGAGMTSKLFVNVREKLSLCYSIGSGYYGSKGILAVSAGIDSGAEEKTRNEILAQLEDCRQGIFTEQELHSAKEAVLSGLRAVSDSPSAIESFCGTSIIGGFPMSIGQYMAAVEAVTAEDVARAAKSVTYHSSFLLKGVTA